MTNENFPDENFPDENFPDENFPEYLRRVGADYAESGSEATAEDYTAAANRITVAHSKLTYLINRASVGGVKYRLEGIRDELVRR